MTDKQKMQGTGNPADAGKPDGSNLAAPGREHGGESGGAAYPNPHTGKKPGSFRGGQTDARYYGGGQIAGDGAREIDDGLDEDQHRGRDGNRLSG